MGKNINVGGGGGGERGWGEIGQGLTGSERN